MEDFKINEADKQDQLKKIAIQEFKKTKNHLWANDIKERFGLTMAEICPPKVKPSQEDIVGNKSHELNGEDL